MKFIQLLFCLIFSIFLFSGLMAQQSKAVQNLNQISDNQWIKDINHKEDFQTYFSKNLNIFGLKSAEDIQHVKTFSTKNDWKHHRFQQYYKGLEVQSGVYILHEKDGSIKKGNGNIFPNIQLSIEPSFSQKEIKSLAENHAISEVVNENNGQYPEGFSENTLHSENPVLVIADQNFPKKSGKYCLAYKLLVGYDALPPRHDEYLIDAKSGKIISIIPQVCEINVEGVANTKYYGEQIITVDSLGPNEFILEDYSRAEGGIKTNDGRNGNQPFSDEDNYWNNVNEFQDEVAGDVHYCAISYYDYLKDKFQFNSIDNEGIEMVSNVHISSTRSYVNAYWTGRTTNYGDGNCLEYGPLTTLDVVAHEFTHGLTDKTSDLIYADDSGGLNEAMSDIFGKAVEYRFDQQNFTWEIGRKFIKSPDADPFRDMSNPNEYGDPKYYKGENWSYTGAVHTNSGVLNYWFYLLVEGETGTNEKGVDYQVNAIGIEKAMDIVFGVQTGYLVPDSDYFHAFESSLEVTEDLYGIDSDEYTAVVEAWKAVGLWRPEPNTLTTDFSIKLLELDDLYCGVDEAEFPLSVEIKNNTLTTFPTGSEIELGHLFYIFGGFNRTTPVLETFVLDTDLEPGDSMVFTFTDLLTFEGAGTYEDHMVAFIGGATGDLFPFNDTTSQEIVASESVGKDLSVSAFNSSVRCTNTGVRFNLSITNEGCETIPDSTEYSLNLNVNGVDYLRNYALTRDLEPGASQANSITIDIPEFLGERNLEYFGQVFFDDDSNMENNESSPRNIRLYESLSIGYIQDFSNFETGNDSIIAVSNSSGALYDLIEYQSNKMIGFSGDEEPRSMNEGCDQVFKVVNDNRRFLSNLGFCVDATGVENPTVSFDMVQFVKETDFLIAPEHTAILRLNAPGIDEQYIFGNQEGEIIKYHIPLPEGFHDRITLEPFTLSGDQAAFSANDFELGDYILIDNIQFTDGTVGTKNQLVSTDFKVFPNPASGVVFFENISPFAQKYNVEIFNTLGVNVLRKEGMSGKASIDTNDLARGIYFYKIKMENDLITSGRLLIEQE